jgi:peroxiredoxin
MVKSKFSIAVLAAVAVACAVLVPSPQAEEKAKKIAIGEAVPNFKLSDTEGKEHTLEQYRGKIVVLDFCSQKCPVSRGADPQISALAKAMEDKEVVFLGIDSHSNTPPEEIRKYATDNGISFPILKDVRNEYADTMGALVTPEIFVVDKEGKLAYHGKFDNRKDPTGAPTVHYVKDAVEALIAGQEIKVTEVKAVGCGIKRVGS